MLQDLHELGANLQQVYLNTYSAQDKELPLAFKQMVREIDGSTISYNNYSFLVTVNLSAQKIFFPNQLMYIAACFADYYNALAEYTQIIKNNLRISDENIKKSKDNPEYAENLIVNSTMNIEDRELLIKFLSDYNWWYGGKGIERADYYISPILALSKLVNASQSYVADLCKYLARNKEALLLLKDEISSRQITNLSLQKIFYGAPGTGKSHTIQKVTAEAEQKGNLFRTTFHPDSDYATFVGCYKPSMESKERRYDKDELISKLAIIKNTGVTYPCHKFAAKYWESLKGMTRDEKKSIITACEFPETMVVEIDKGIVIGEELSHGTNQKQIVYRFVAQAFANAYVRAWQKNQENEKVFLVIEEINRGNCAQIFGDLFQLLDRDDEGYSKYPIIPDADLADFICEHLQTYENIPEAIREGLEIKLPSNFYIWASMNTSDQSLFPIDSAFKRRWDWEYIPIENHPDEDYKIHINGSVYDWWDFIQAINKEVFELTHSEDKQLGYFFVRPQNGIIDANMLVNKVYFYLWNDVFKDYDIESQKAFKKPDSNEAIAFKDFFEGGLNEKLAEQVLINLELGEEIQTAE